MSDAISDSLKPSFWERFFGNDYYKEWFTDQNYEWKWPNNYYLEKLFEKNIKEKTINDSLVLPERKKY